MFKLEVDLDDLTLEGLDAVLGILFDNFKGSFTTDWSATGPIIERLGMDLTYIPPAKDPSKRLAPLVSMTGEQEEEQCWMADYGGESELHAKPLVAVVKVLIRSKMPNQDLALPAEVAIKYLKKESTAVHGILEEGDYHDVEQSGDDINTYSLTPKPDCMEEFQGIVRVIKKLSSLRIINEHQDADGAGGTDMLIVKHSLSWERSA